MERTRAQTAVDFAIAMGVFLVALATVVAFMPTMTQPFTGGQQNPLLADRLASQLTDGQLGEPSDPSELNATCTMYFFNSSGESGPCGSFDATEDVQTKLGVSSAVQVNVSIQKNFTGSVRPEIVCASDGAEDLSEPPCSGETLVDGPSPPTASGSVTIARRYATLDDEPVYVVVRVWT